MLPLCAVILSVTAQAQRTASLGASIASVRYDDSVAVMAASVEPTLRYESHSVSLMATGMYSHLTPESGLTMWSSEGGVAGSAFTPAVGALRGELAARAGMIAHQGGSRTGQWQTVGRAHLMGVRRGVWAGGGVGRTWDGVVWRDVLTGDAGAWARHGRSMLVAVASPMSVSSTDGGAVRYTDLEFSARWNARRVELGGMLGTRAGDATSVAASDERVWGSGTARLRLGGFLALVASAGTYPVDYAQGFPGGSYVSLAFDLARHSPSANRATSAYGETGDAPIGGVAVVAFTAELAPADAHRLRLRAPGATRVEIAGSFSSWEPLALKAAGEGWWETHIALPAGTHEISARVDGGAWDAPPGLFVVTDELGGRSGLLVIP